MFTIRRPELKDNEQVNNLFRIVIYDSFIKDGANINSSEIIKEINDEIALKSANLRQDFQSNGKDEYFLIAGTDNQIIGTIAYGSINETIKKNYTISHNNLYELKSAFVLPEFQGKGAGTLLFNAILISLHQRNIEHICLDSGYKQGQKFWINKIGNPSLVLKDYYGKNSDYMIWYHQLKSEKIQYNR